MVAKPPCLQGLKFDWDAPYPRGPDLPDCLQNLLLGGLFEIATPTLPTISLASEADSQVPEPTDPALFDC